MKYSPLFALATLAFAGAALADAAPGEPLTRAQVRASVVAARADGTLLPAGEAGLERATRDEPAAAGAAGLTRAQVHASVAQALAAGTLAHAGSTPPEQEAPLIASTRSRAAVKAEVRLAQSHHELVPAGEGQSIGAEPAAHVATGAGVSYAALPGAK